MRDAASLDQAVATPDLSSSVVPSNSIWRDGDEFYAKLSTDS